jgi:hypothetical protein
MGSVILERSTTYSYECSVIARAIGTNAVPWGCLHRRGVMTDDDELHAN